MYQIEAVELMRRNLHLVFDQMIEQLATDDTTTFLEFSLKVKNIESLREEIDFSFDGVICYIYRQIIDPTKDESIF